MNWRTADQVPIPWETALIVDLFAGGGGASLGIEAATGQHVGVAVNHDEHAIDMHWRNHPHTRHHHSDVWEVDPVEACRGRSPRLLWGSFDCRHFSRANGGRVLSEKVRALPWVIVKWAREVMPLVIEGENVAEFMTWGPLYPDDHPDPKLRGRPIPERKGEFFRAWVEAFRELGYVIEWRILNAADFGVPTARKRWYFVARRDGRPIVWPKPTHGPGLLPRRQAAECIDWSIPSLSVFATRDEAREFKAETGLGARRPLAKNTMRRVLDGLQRYVLDAEDPYLVDGAMVPWLVSTRNGERKGQRPRTRSVRDPLPTITAKGSQGALCCAWLAKHYGGVVGSDLRQPLGTITATDHHSLCAAYLTAYYGSSVGSDLREPMQTITTRDRFGLVLVEIDGTTYEVRDVTMRMLHPRELARGMGFPESYTISGTKKEQVARIGNAVCPDMAEAITRANLPELARGRA
jgi:DNA (cytosine-5)-methyltransferase 1